MLIKEVDLNRLIDNYNYIKKSTGKDIIPVVKSNAYSLGVLEVTKKFIESGVKLIGVNDLEEAIEIANKYLLVDILIFNSIDLNDFSKLYLYNNFILTINSVNDIKKLNEYCYLNKIRVHLQIDTGMNRLGIRTISEYKEVVDIIKDNEKFQIEGIYTHYTSINMYEIQKNKFSEYLDIYQSGIIHSSASSTYSRNSIGDFLRIGLDLYGDGTKEYLNQVISIYTKPIEIKKLLNGETLGYNESFIATSDVFIAVLPIGYFDGYRRDLNGFHVYANNHYYEVVGKVCMNHIFILVDESIDLDTKIEIIGDNVKVSDMAKYLNTIPGDILCGFKIKNTKYKCG